MYARAGARQSFFEKEPSPSHCPAESPVCRAFPPSGARRQPSRILHGCFIARKTVSVFSETVSVFQETVSVFSETVSVFQETVSVFRETVSVFQETATALSAESMRQNSAVGISSFLIYISHSSFLIPHLKMPHSSFKNFSFLISHLSGVLRRPMWGVERVV